MRWLDLFRLAVTLLVLGFAMANPAAAVPAMMSGVPASSAQPGSVAMPCHEMPGAEVASSVAPMISGTIAGGAHLCCVMACLVVPPLDEIALSYPMPRVSVLAPAAQPALSGRMVAMPTPPPRTS